MATKPIGISFAWATAANYSTGPNSGTPTKVPLVDVSNGYVPGNAYPSQHTNDAFNRAGLTCTWVEAGSNAASADAHIVETDASGVAGVLGVDAGGVPASTDRPVDVSANSPTVEAFRVSFDATGAGNPPTSAALISCLGSSNAGAHGIEMQHLSGGYAFRASCSTDSQGGVYASLGSSSSEGFLVTWGSTAYTGAGFRADVSAAGNGAEFQLTSTGDGVYVANSPGLGGYGINLAASDPNRSPMHFNPTRAPLFPGNGDVWFESAAEAGHGKSECIVRDSEGRKVIHATPGGFRREFDYIPSNVSSTGTTETAIASVTLDSSHPAGLYTIRGKATCSSGVGGSTVGGAIINVRAGGGPVIDSARLSIGQLEDTAGGSSSSTACVLCEYDHDGTSTVDIELLGRSFSDATASHQWSRRALEVMGVY